MSPACQGGLQSHCKQIQPFGPLCDSVIYYKLCATKGCWEDGEVDDSKERNSSKHFTEWGDHHQGYCDISLNCRATVLM